MNGETSAETTFELALPPQRPTLPGDSLAALGVAHPAIAPTIDPLLGRTIDRYQVLERIGEGGMGAVYAVEHVMLRKRMAMKVLRPELGVHDELLGRFHQEAIAASRIGQENIVSVTDFGRTEDGVAYLVMEELRGVSLSQAIRSGSGLPPARAVAIAAQIARALEAAHAAGIVHRDLKPDNVMLLPRDGGELVKILDFGVSKVTCDDDQRRTQVGMILGTPEYMSPEQSAGKAIDLRSDVYSFGVVLFEMLSGQTPFWAENPMQLLLKHQAEAPPTLASVAPEAVAAVPALAHLVARCLEKRPEDRPQDMSACLAGLRALSPEVSQATATPPPRAPSPGAAFAKTFVTTPLPKTQSTPLPPVDGAPHRQSLSPMFLGRYRLARQELGSVALTPEEAYVASRLSGCELSASEVLSTSG
ncbi:MAG: serine/threonine-protein kinase, partial [Deltaproteobacteria bacterium]